MKIVGFESNNGVRLGVVDGDNVIDLQTADANVPGDLGEVLRRSNGDLKGARRNCQEGASLRTTAARRIEISRSPSRAPAKSFALV